MPHNPCPYRFVPMNSPGTWSRETVACGMTEGHPGGHGIRFGQSHHFQGSSDRYCTFVGPAGPCNEPDRHPIHGPWPQSANAEKDLPAKDSQEERELKTLERICFILTKIHERLDQLVAK